jgi:hypothetical protein
VKHIQSEGKLQSKSTIKGLAWFIWGKGVQESASRIETDVLQKDSENAKKECIM